ncbi:MAG: hypothetical protein WC780_01595 [Lentimicrobiaceae bacterium]|jgi:hypothetical protein
MKKQLCFLLAMVVIFLFACEPPVVFDKPQPADVADLGGFPKRIQGKYLSSEDSSILQITGNSIIRIYDFDEKMHLSQVDSNQQIIGDTLFNLKTNEGQHIQIEGDSIIMHIHEMDTLFVIDEENVLKKFKGYYFVNIFIPPDTWQVKKLDVSRGMLSLSSINKKEDIEQLKILTETTQDTMPYVFSPTKYQFKKFVGNEGFRDSEKFMKIRE